MPAPDVARPWHSQGTPELCPSIRVAETTSPLPLPPMTSANPSAPLPRNAARLLAVMFATEDVCQRSLEDIAGEGFDRRGFPRLLRRLVEAGFLSQAARARLACPDTYRLHLPPVQP